MRFDRGLLFHGAFIYVVFVLFYGPFYPKNGVAGAKKGRKILRSHSRRKNSIKQPYLSLWRKSPPCIGTICVFRIEGAKNYLTFAPEWRKLSGRGGEL
jgi:hypothetical protein